MNMVQNQTVSEPHRPRNGNTAVKVSAGHYNYESMVQRDSHIMDVTPSPMKAADYFFVPAVLRGLGTTLRHCLGNVGRDGSNKKNIWVVQYPEQKRDDRSVLDGRGDYRMTRRFNILPSDRDTIPVDGVSWGLVHLQSFKRFPESSR